MVTVRGNLVHECIFCHREQSSEEHVFGRWITRSFADGAPFTLHKTPGRSTSGLKKINIKSRAPCQVCNSGWMSQTEEEAKDLLSPMFRGEETSLDAEQQFRVARWTFKTALMLDRSSLASQVVPSHHFGFLFEHRSPPESVTIYLARYFPEPAEEHLGIIGSSFAPAGPDPHLYPNPYQITFSVGQAVFQIFGHSGVAKLEIRRLATADSGLFIPMQSSFEQLWPIRTSDLSWPPNGFHLNTRSLMSLARF